MEPTEGLDAALAYHERTKHGFGRFAASLGYLDWNNQPDPFRRFDGARRVALPVRETVASPSWEAVFAPDALEPWPLDADLVSELFFRSLALSAWKEYRGSRWALRCNPSSGNLHPTEGYLVCGRVAGLAETAGVWHYAPRDHALEERCRFGAETWTRLVEGFPANTVLVGLSSIHWREAWKYGERAYRYCQHDVGHAIGAVALAAASLGWRAVWLDALGDDDVARLLGLDRDGDFAAVEVEREHPDLVMALFPARGANTVPNTLPAAALEAIAGAAWQGTANRLSAEHVRWEVIDAVAAACLKPGGQAGRIELARAPASMPGPRSPQARVLFRQRRSAVDLDGRTSISLDTFAGMLEHLMPRPGRPPFDVLPDTPAVHLLLFVHRVDGLEPGLYCLLRGPVEATLRAAMLPELLWQAPPGAPASLPLRLLARADCRQAATRLSCDQAIAGHGAFSLGMLAELEGRLRAQGAWCYRRLFWEAGLVGQVLYLEAEAAGVRGTGIGCYYDDPVHDVCGLAGHAWQSLYHFTVGGAVEDERLTTVRAP